MDRGTYKYTALCPTTGRKLLTLVAHGRSFADVEPRGEAWRRSVQARYGLDDPPKLLVERLPDAGTRPVSVELF